MATSTVLDYKYAVIDFYTAQNHYKYNYSKNIAKGVYDVCIFETLSKAEEVLKIWMDAHSNVVKKSEEDFKEYYSDYCHVHDVSDEVESRLLYNDWLKEHYPNGEGYYDIFGDFLGTFEDTVFNFGDNQYYIEPITITEHVDDSDEDEIVKTYSISGRHLDVTIDEDDFTNIVFNS